MKVLVTGARGMLGQDLVPVLTSRGHAVSAAGHRELDVADAQSVQAAFEAVRPELVIQCAAYTNVDGAEADRVQAFTVNSLGTRLVALRCREAGIPMVYVSTDYVFDGTLTRPYLEFDATNPLSVYGQSKLAGEQAVREVLDAFYIVRTSWLYGAFGKNFVDTMRQLGRSKPALTVVDDQHGSPTWTVELSRAIADLIETGIYGTYHVTGQGETTWYDFARTIMAHEGLETPIHPISTADFNRPAPRPRYSVLENLNLQLAGVAVLPHWTESLTTYLAIRH